jgi:ATP-binding cassette subfamily C protein CydC
LRSLLRLAALILPHWRRILVGIALSLVAVLANLGLLALSSWFVASMALAGAAGLAFAYDLPAAGVRALAILRAVGRYAERLVNHDTTLRILGSLRLWFFRRVEPLAPARLERYRSGDILSRICADVDALDDFYVRALIPLAVAFLSAACLVPFLARYDPRLVAIELVCLAFAGLALPLALGAAAARDGGARAAAAASLRSLVIEEVQGMAELLAFGASERHAARIEGESRRLDAIKRRLDSLQGWGGAGTIAASSMAAWATALALIGPVSRGALTGADMAMLTALAFAAFEIVQPLPAALQKGREMAAASARLFEVLAEDGPGAPLRGGLAAGIDRRPAVAVDLSIRDLSFRYDADEPWVLELFSLEAAAGERIGLIGPSGSGKSTLFSLLLGFRSYGGGSIALSERGDPRLSAERLELKSMHPDDGRLYFSAVPQLPHLFHATIRENLLIAEGEADGPPPDEDRLLSVLRDAQLSELVRSLPLGLDTMVGESGRSVSGGEARRIAVARALLKDAPIYLFDEPTEGLDETTAEAMLAAIEERLRGKTIIIASHRPRDLAFVDRRYEAGRAE